MDVLKNLSCLNCGGEVTLSEDGREATCKYCRRTYRIGSTLKDGALISFAFATEYLKSFRFADAKRKFSEVASESPEFSEAWWGAFIAEYGIEFGRNRLGETVPTCHRAHTVKVSDDPSYKMAIETADEKARKEYISLGEKIEYVRSEIIEKAENGEIYDVFICFKATETDSGRKTEDYYLGRDIYHELKDEGYNVFFSAETLKRIGEQEFEPYIFRALSTARVMLVLCSDNEKLESAWVKNEWSRFLDMKGGKGLIPVCGNNAERYSPYDLPEELRRLNAIEFGGNLFEDLKTKTEACFPERVKARTEAEKKAREAEYEARYARERAADEERTNKLREQMEAERQAQAELLKKQQEQLDALMRKLSAQNAPEEATPEPLPQTKADEAPKNAEKTTPSSDVREKAKKLSREAEALSRELRGNSAKTATKPSKKAPAPQKAESTEKTPKESKSTASAEPLSSENARRDPKKVPDEIPEAKDLVMVIDNGVLKSIKVKNQSAPFSVTLPEYVKKIDSRAFSDCKCSEVKLPSGLNEIDSLAFEGCKTLRSISVSDSVTCIKYFAFAGCDLLTEIRVSDDNKNYRSVNGDLYSKDGKKLIQYAIGKQNISFTVPNGVTEISASAFSGCKAFKSIKIPNGVNKISSNAFSHCEVLSDIDIPKSVTYIGISAFAHCRLLKKISLPDSITEIGRSAFSDCESLTNITLPNGVTSISEALFKNCSSLESVTLPDGIKDIGQDAFVACSSLKSITLPESLTKIGRGAFTASRLSYRSPYTVNYQKSPLFIINYRGTKKQWKALIKNSDPEWDAALHYTVNFKYTEE